MSRTAKILVSLLLVGVVFVGCAALLLWRYVDGHRAGWLEAGQTALQDGARDGAAMDDASCIEAGFARLRQDASLAGLRSRLWLKGCVDASRPKDGACAHVPRVDQFVDTVRWTSAFCAARGFNNHNGCNGLAQEVQMHCLALTASRP